MALRQEVGGGAAGAGTATATGLLLASRRLAGMVMSPVAGHLSDRLGSRRPVAVAGTVGLAAGFLVLVLGPRGLSTVVIGVVLTALGEGILHPALAAWVGDATPEHRRGVMMGALATGLDLTGAYGLCAGLVASSTLVLLVAPARSGLGSLPPGEASGRRTAPGHGA